MQIIKKVFEFIVFSNLWVALSAAGLTLNSFLFLKQPVNVKLVLFVFFSTIAIYNLQRLIKHFYKKQNHNSRHLWFYKYHSFVLSLVIMTGLGSSVLAFYLFTIKDFIYLIPFGLASLFYAVSIFPNQKSLRDLPFLKIFLIASTWAVCAVVLPLVVLDLYFGYHTFLLFLTILTYILAVTIPFDIRDLKLDKSTTKTIPQILGINKSINLSLVLLLLCTILSFIIDKSIYLIPISIATLVLYFARKEKPELFYSGLIDGIILFFPIAGYLSS